ncbi:MAG: membrane protein insertion efficiency factor YidD [Thiomonas sp. 20-64-5]|nr:MAG: membrane protein insertion efficiency factor YidD [Thiomonas sp. 20-64-5]
MKQLLIGLVRLYRLLLSPWVGGQCRFYPTCSAYTIEALDKHGAAAGSYLGAVRILRCQPWCQGGHEPVPAQFTWAPWRRDDGHETPNPLSPQDMAQTASSQPMHNSASLPEETAPCSASVAGESASSSPLPASKP